MKIRKKLTRGALKRILHYDPETGVFRWRVKKNRNITVGQIAGATLANGNVTIGIDGRNYYAHRLAVLYMTGKWPDGLVDHRDGNPSINKWSNLRDSTREQNNRNKGIRKDNSSGYTGVSWCKARGKWEARIKTRIYLGCFDDIEDAVEARRRAEDEMYGEYSYGNSRGRY